MKSHSVLGRLLLGMGIVVILSMVLVQEPGGPTLLLGPLPAIQILIGPIMYLAALIIPVDTKDSDQPVGLIIRLCGSFCDLLVAATFLGLAMMLLGYACQPEFFGATSFCREPETGAGTMGEFLFLLFGLWALLSIPIVMNRQSVGPQIFGYWVAKDDPSDVAGALLRPALGFLTFSCGVISIPMALRRTDKRMFHDLACGTRLVRSNSHSR